MNLILITSIYPFDKGEEFLETEIVYLAPKFNKIIIIPVKVKCDSRQTRSLPTNVAVQDIAIREANLLNKSFRIINFLKYLILGIKEEKAFSRKKIGRLTYIINNAAILNHNLNKIIRISADKKFTIYSYWFTSILLGVFFNTKLGKSVSRLHGGDLYEDRNHIPFRKFIYKKIDYLCPISADGKEYLKNRYDINSQKLHVNRLGVEDLGTIEPLENQSFTILSCSFLVEIKRIYLIIDALSMYKSEQKIRWIHIGNGPLYDALHKEANEKLNCHFELIGYVPNKDLVEVYKKYKPNLFLNCSASEGIPVSMMEAISFGVPILATNVGGVSEIVNDKTGFLLNEHVSAQEIYLKLNQIIKYNLADDKRKSTKDFYLSKYNASKNYNAFITNILLN